MDLIIQELTRGLPERTDVIVVGARLVAAALFGGIIGYERERAGKAAGLRTHMLVSLGAALFVLAAAQVDFNTDGLSRIIQGLVTGIGFLGGGAILKSKEGHNIEGLTTAAGIWLTAGIGVACGLGTLGIALITVVLAWIILTALLALERRTPTYAESHNNTSSPHKH